MTAPAPVCTACGRRLPVEDHHIAGEANDPATTNACTKGCHQFLSRRQLDNGVDLDREGPKDEVDMARARALGLNDLLSLSARRRHPEMVPMADTFDTCTAIASALLDLSDEPVRPGRWLPDTVGARHRRSVSYGPVTPTEGTEMEVIQQMAGAVVAMGPSLLMDESELMGLSQLVEDAGSVYQAFSSLLDGDVEIQAAWAEVPARMVAFSHRFERYLVTIFNMVTSNPDGDLSELVEMGRAIAPVTRAMRTFVADAVAAVTVDEWREVLLRLPRALELSESLDR